ncbi:MULTISPECIES: hypothetical protein [Pseudomonas]|uniref:hypothetical protein n=1 Tax=Pseudomonas TaxID=286 RepID=UPI002264E308|nr:MULTISPECIES: hypothetical protein [Pseudomonas]MDC7815121.1 hypothetical protein [Pseudomonas sp. BLCC-B112]
MSKLACRCGHIIIDQTDDLPYKAALLRDEHEERFFADASLLANELLDAASAGKVDKLLEQHYGNGHWRPGPMEFFGDKFTSVYLSSISTVYECERCGRLWVQKEGANHFVCFTPESGQYESILRSQVP